MHSINMPNTSQNNEIEDINKEISSLQDRLEINKKNLNQFKNGLRQIRRLRLKQGQTTNLSETKKIQETLKNIFKNKIKHIKKSLKNALVNVKKRKRLSEKGLNKIAKMQNLSQNEFNQITVIRGLSRDELKQMAKIRRIKNSEDTKKDRDCKGY